MPDQATTPKAAPHPDAPRRAGIAAEFRGSPLGLLVQTSAKPWVVVGETLLLPLLALLVGMWANPANPLWVEAEFPWAWLAPVVVALRYGPVAGLSASGVLLLAWLGVNQRDLSLFPEQYFLGGLILVMVVGEISSLWRAHTPCAHGAELHGPAHRAADPPALPAAPVA